MCAECGETVSVGSVLAPAHTYTDVNDNICDVCGEDLSLPYYVYTVTDGKATITDMDTAVSGDVVIPATLGGYPVAAIGNNAFRDCKNITSITIPESVTTIGNYAFRDCTSLQTVYYNAVKCTSAGVNAYPVFYGCTALTTAYIGKSAVEVAPRLFRAATALTTVYLTKNTKTIGANAFYQCEALTDVYFVGSAGSFANVDIKSYNTPLTNAAISYNAPCFDGHEWTAECDSLCDFCGTVRTTTHDNVVNDAAVVPTCVETGLTAGSHCETCGNVIVKQSVVSALGHTWDAGEVVKQPTAGENGTKMYTCATCGDTKTVELTLAEIRDGYYYYNGALKPGAGLVKVEDAYYFITSSAAVKTGRYTVSDTGDTGLQKGAYYFFADGKMNLTCGVYEGKYYNDQGIGEAYAGLVEVNGSKYYVGSGGNVTTGRYFVTKLNGLLPKKRAYTFFDDGRMLEDTRVHTDGYYYESGLRVPYAGLIEYEGSYYYVADNGQYVTGRKFISNLNNTGKVKGYYYFDANGKMLTGKRVVYGYYYEEGYAPSYVGLVKVNAYYYYVQLNGAVVKNNSRFFVSKTNGLMDKGYYAFDANGRLTGAVA